MEWESCSRLLLSVLIILLALECSCAKCCEGNDGGKKDWPKGSKNMGNGAFFQGVKFKEGRKMLQVLQEEKRSHFSGKNKLVDLQNTLDAQNTPTSSGDKNDAVENEKALLEAEDEIMNLMRRDYKGKPRRKPPINNREPKN
ncbi:root meristem growth factor [Striga asiatica]|uniref:Root meristem growth factor n=1 Tax=Striga asiatica TaxID=4170 RepID=A0A5A7QW14_STRAF|nr:root meristem growth factor [Striga asiatica]